MTASDIRDLRESKGLSQTAAAEICGLTFSRYERIELGSPRTTDAEIAAVKKALRGAKKTGKKLVGRPFSDPVKQAAVEAARAEGRSVSAVLAQLEGIAKPAPAKAAAPASKPTAEKAATPAAKKAAAKKAPAKPRSRRTKKDEVADLI